MAKKLTDESINEYLSNTKSKFQLVLGTYLNSRTKATFKCIDCGEEVCTYYSVLKISYLCPKCSIPIPKTTWDIAKIEDLLKDTTLILVSKEYKNSSTPLELRCKLDGNTFKRSLSHLKTNTNCNTCENRPVQITWTKALVVSWLKENRPNIVLLSKDYISIDHHLKFKCTIDNYVWSTRLGAMKGSHIGCPKCSGNVKYEDRDLQKELDTMSSGLTLTEIHKNTTTNPLMTFKCRKRHHIFTSRWNEVSSTKSCQVCNGSVTMNIGEAKELLLERSPDIQILSEEFKGYKSNLELSCKVCSHTWSATFSNMYRLGTGCPKCSFSSLTYYSPTLALQYKSDFVKKLL